MVAHIMVHWNLKQAIMFEVPIETVMGKIHSGQHIANQ